MIHYSLKDRKIVAFTAILSGVLALACLVVGMIATQFDSEAFSNPIKLLFMPAVDIGQIRAFMLLDLFGYYLLLLPVIFFVQNELKSKTAWASMLTSLGFGYVIVGAIGAAVLAEIWPSLIDQHEKATELTKEIYKAEFLVATDFVVKGLWNCLEIFLGGVWWLTVGSFIKSKGLKITTQILGVACLMDGIGTLLQCSWVEEIGLNVYLILGIVWPIWMGIAILRDRFSLK